VARQSIERQSKVSSELVPFQEIDVYAKESGYIKELSVDYGSHVKQGQLLAVLEIPELQMQLTQDDAAIKNQQDMVRQTQHQIDRLDAQQKVYHDYFTRLKGVSDKNPGMVALQELDDAQGKDLAALAQIESAKSTNQAAQSELEAAQAKKSRDQVMFDYARVTAPFAGVVTQRYANYGTLVQAGTSSSTNVLPIVKLSEDDKFRLVIPVPEAYIKFIHIGDRVDVHVSSLDRTFPGQVARSSEDIREDTRTMHTEVDVINSDRLLFPGMYADAVLTLQKKNNVLAVPLQAVNQEPERVTVYVVMPDNRIEVRAVQLGLQSTSDAEVVSGLKEGENVVVSDRSALKTGTLVQPHQVPTNYQSQGQ
jgi:RND family efflux transporter MFP subunit